MGRLIIARQGVEPQNPPQPRWWLQVESLVDRIAPFVPGPNRGVILTSAELPAITMADFLYEVLDLPVRTKDELTIGGSKKPSRKQALSAVMAELDRYPLVVVVSHEPICERLATDAVKQLAGVRMAAPPNFTDHASAVMIRPDRAPRPNWSGSYL